MRIGALKIKNVRSFIDVQMEFSDKINVIVGPNNSGKSSIIKSIAIMQYNGLLSPSDIRKSSTEPPPSIEIQVVNVKNYLANSPDGNDLYRTSLQSVGRFKYGQQNQLEQNEPKNFIYPYFSHRKVSTFQEDIREVHANNVRSDLSNLSAKLSMVTSVGHPQYQIYKDTCEALLGFFVGNIPSPQGQEPGIYVTPGERIPLRAMGDGVALLVGFLVNLVISENKLFLIEEPENDIHPVALKKLLRLIAESSQKNQFIISTHSNIVVKTLGCIPSSKVFSLSSNIVNSIQTTSINKVQTIEDRRLVLEDLGYEFYDEDSFNAWIFFEEASAERIVRDFLIPWFTPSLVGKIRTFSCRTVVKVQKRFDEFNSLFCFLNLEPKYKNKAWVIVDSGNNEQEVLNSLKDTYVKKNSWKEDNFIQLGKHNFEEYYPDKFENEKQTALTEPNEDKKRNLKRDLLENVVSWSQKESNEAKEQFSKSANEIIEFLLKIEKSING